MKKKSDLTVRQATELVYTLMPEKFSAVTLCRKVQLLTGRDSLMDGTILRRLREARNENSQKYDYRCIDPERSLYKKIVYQPI